LQKKLLKWQKNDLWQNQFQNQTNQFKEII